MESLPAQVRSVFDQCDRATGTFARESGLACPPGCGACCHSPEVEASELEMLPMVEHLWETGEAESILEQLTQSPDQKVCLFFRPVPGSTTDGRCSRYPQRPLVCRLFGFAGRRDKNGRPQFNACKIHQQHLPGITQEVMARVEAGTLRPPLFGTAVDALWAVHPTLGLDRYPINEALRRTLERFLFGKQFEETPPPSHSR